MLETVLTNTTRVHHLWGYVRRGVIAGVVGTIAMTVPILAGQRSGLFTNPPPREISANVARRTWLLPERSDPAFPLVWSSGHLAYGGACGVVFTLVRRYLPAAPSLAGLLFGLAVWAVSYLGLIPALRLYPWPADDSRPRQLVMIAAHGVFGVTVAQTARHLR